MPVNVIILNGPSSAGKTSLGRALQNLLETPYLLVQMDAFLEMLPPWMANHSDAFAFKHLEGQNPPQVEITTGVYGQRLMKGMRDFVLTLADAGHALIVDDVMLDGEQTDYQSLLCEHTVRFVGVSADLSTLEDRERQRGDRDIGQTRWQHKRVHEKCDYDLEIDTTNISPEEGAQRVKRALNL